MRKIYVTLFALLALCTAISAQTLMQMPPHSTTFSGNVRGFWFESPECFTITAVDVPTDASTGAVSLAVLRLDTAPPLYATTTNNFTVLYLTQNNSGTGPFPVNIQVQAGDFIGVLGFRGTSNSYASGPYVSSINGTPVTISRLGMQFSLATTPPQNIWTESGGSISRSFLYYDSTLTFNLTATQTGPGSFDFDNGADSTFASFWDFGDGNTATVNTPSHTYLAAGTYNVCSYITTTCGTDTVCSSVVVCDPDPIAAFSPVASGMTISFVDSSYSTVSWMWDFGDGNTDTTSSPSHTYTAVGNYVVCLLATNGCGVTDTLCDTIFVCDTPGAAFSYTTGAGGLINFSNSSTLGSGYLWDFGDSSTDTTMSPNHTYASDGSYVICLTVTNACGSDTYCDTVTVCTVALTAGFSSSSNQFDYTFSSTGTGASTYAWDFGDGNTSTSMSPTHTYAANGTYVVCLTVGNACGDVATTCDTITVLVIGVANALPGFSIEVSPNPMSQLATVAVVNPGEQGDYSFELYNVLGAKVRTVKGTLNQNLQFDRKGLANGQYIFRIQQGDLQLGSGRIILE